MTMVPSSGSRESVRRNFHLVSVVLKGSDCRWTHVVQGDYTLLSVHCITAASLMYEGCQREK